ncbi:MAG: lipase [Pseudomonadales bacterium]|nr:lipase [Pseudomonadales bacterium]
MQVYSARALREGPVAMVGALDFDQREHGISPRRLPAWTRPQVPQNMDVMVRMPAGVRLAFVTDSPVVRLDVLTTAMVTPPRPPRPVAFDLVVDGDVRSLPASGGNTIVLDPTDPLRFTLERGDAYSVVFDNLGTTSKHCELWLPHNAFVEIRALGIDDGATLAAPPAPQTRWVHYGSSISHCMEALSPTGTWPAVASMQAGVSLTGLGFGGQCHLDPFVARTIRDLPVDLISVKTGINVVNMDSMRERTFVPALHGFIDTIREARPDTPIVLTSPIFCPSAEDFPGPTVPDERGKFVTLRGHEAVQAGCLTLRRIREIIAGVVDTRRELGDRHIGYLDGLMLFSEADAGDLPDDLHPNPGGYRRMGERFADLVFGPDGLASELGI